ncbi:hypothetical protein QT969_21635 [Rhodococcus sp. CSLK01-03]|uniref:SMP-30/Gluconolactonase/LRE-like region domain-containing protein n=1 Tax=Rhodococcus indonesiensis TaxID=3055869 RepID=A0ABT7RTC1_9NOCA|nr:hypothetical protein [Rhodococcus indonesiensis]MDM7490892.1 hypothetical protein [Rhodococcus indonesiensis]
MTITCRNGLDVSTADGNLHIVYEDVAESRSGGPVACRGRPRQIKNGRGVRGARPVCIPTSLALGGPDGRDVYVGWIATDYLATFRAPTRGLR